MKAKRGYSKEFTPRQRVDRKSISVDWIPPTLFDAITAKCKREGVSKRTLVLRLLKDWVSEPPAPITAQELDEKS